jgi:methionyl-tRNA formyltransferase
MKIEDLRIAFMGTPEFAVPSLEKLLEAGSRVVAVVTAPDRPAGRGMKIRVPPIKEFARTHDLPVFQPENLREPAFVEALEALEPDLQVVVAFRMLPEVVWRIPRLGTFNLHASLLPQYRGAAPINHAIMNGEKETGVTTFMIDEQIDTGNILLQEKTRIGHEESAGDLHDRLMVLGAGLVLETAKRLAAGDIRTRSQEDLTGQHQVLKKAPRIHREDCLIHWDRTAEQVYNLIRGLSPHPGAYTCLTRKTGEGVLCKIFSSGMEERVHHEVPGTFRSDGKSVLKVAVQDGYIHILSIQQEGKRRLDTREFLAGISLASFQPRFSEVSSG